MSKKSLASYCTDLQALCGGQTSKLNWRKGEIIAEVVARWGQRGLHQLQTVSQLDPELLLRYQWFYETFPTGDWVADMAYEFHVVISWHYQLARKHVADYGTSGRKPVEWVRLARKEKWTLDDFQGRVTRYYGTTFRMHQRENLSIFKRYLEEDASQLHPALREEIRRALAAIEKAQQRRQWPAATPSSNVVPLVRVGGQAFPLPPDRAGSLAGSTALSANSAQTQWLVTLSYQVEAEDVESALILVEERIKAEGVQKADSLHVREVVPKPAAKAAGA